MSKFCPSDYGSNGFRKHRKFHQGKIEGFASESGCQLDRFNYGLKVLEGSRVKPESLEAARKCLVRSLGKNAEINFRTFAHRILTAKPAEVRMGGGKGSPDRWVCIVRAGQVLIEVNAASYEQAKSALQAAQYKLNVPTRIIRRNDV